ncbi:PRA1 family protein F3-like [Euphorbia lathyris]|uniref:PRA1 family protein F3-like n=1 Tax=Euphorbia lathyris TaxID=212925 RepID=UPI003313C0EB
MTTYGTIPSEPHTTISNPKEKLESSLGTRRPWKELMNISSCNIPADFDESLDRIRTNISYFRYNYIIIILSILFLSLLWHPISLIVFILMMSAWLFLYFLRDDPLIMFGVLMDDKMVMGVLLGVTVVLLFFTDVTNNIVSALVLGVGVVCVHGGFRKVDDLMYMGGGGDEEQGF